MTTQDLLAEPSKLESVYVLAPVYGVSITTMHRWRKVGFPDRNGGRVRLPCVLLGNEWRTSREAVVEFVAAISAEGTKHHRGEPATALAV